ncbi:Disease resistance protein L6 [Linum perenne]
MDSPLNRSETSLPTGEYEVFLSFRGPDVRTSFADCLYSCLHRSKIRTFRDEEELRKGEQIAPSLVQAILESKIHIPIFSQNYASSKWCLQELAKMVECWKQDNGHVILPIFYFVNPRDVRHQYGPYKEAFQLHAQKHDADTVKEWREALQEVGKMKGWTVNDSDGQGAIIDEVFSRVDSLLMRKYKLVADQDLVGVDFHVEQVVKLLDLDSQSVEVVSIHGIGGAGKTTISKAVYDKVFSQFDRCCFLEDVRETLKKKEGLVNLQNKVLSTILRHDCKVENASEGCYLIKDRVCKHKVLVILDDIDHMFEFDKFLGDMDDFASGSRFLVTTRDQSLNFHQDYKSYELGEMSHDHSLQLFCKHAFRMDYPPEDYVTLSSKFVEAAAGLPLALEVMGSLLFRKKMKIWEENLIRFKEIPHCKVQERLKISYDALNYEEQQIFLDIACLFIGENKTLPLYMWGGCNFYPESGIDTLVLRSLIKINEKDEFWMHDHIRDLGRAIVRDEGVEHPGSRSRIWSNNDALDMLKNMKGTDHVRSLKVYGDNCVELTNEEFRKLSGLRYLEVVRAGLTGDFKEILPEIRWLELFFCASVPTSFRMDKLVILQLSNLWVGDDWLGWRELKMAHNLKVLHLLCCYKLTKAPDLSACGSLEVVNLQDCNKMSGEMHVGNFKHLKELIIIGCGITKLTGNLVELENLQVINFSRCFGVPLPLLELPTSVKQLIISSTVANLSKLRDLEELRFQHCTGGLRITGDLQKLSKLKTLELWLSPCDSLLVDVDLGLPSSLVSIWIKRCEPLQRLPNIQNLSNLTEMLLEDFGVAEIHGLGGLTSLVTLHISKAPNLENLDGLENLMSMTNLTVEECCALKRLPSLAALNKLLYLLVCQCQILAEIRGLAKSLSRLEISWCPSLAIIEGLEPLVALEKFILSGCDLVSRLPHLPSGLKTLRSLVKLKISNCDSLERLPDLSHLTSLKELTISRCVQLLELTGFEELELLEVLFLMTCESLLKIPSLSSLRNLKELTIWNCEKLAEIEGLEMLEEQLTVQSLGTYENPVEKLGRRTKVKRLLRSSARYCKKVGQFAGVFRN